MFIALVVESSLKYGLLITFNKKKEIVSHKKMGKNIDVYTSSKHFESTAAIASNIIEIEVE